MELAVLDPSFRREKLVENWNSLVWTERYSSNGDFQLVSSNIAEIVQNLPVGGPLDPPTLVAIADSNVPMVVENHKIDKKKNAIPTITTTGRSFETVLNQRIAARKLTSPLRRSTWAVAAQTAAIAAYEVAKEIIVDGDLDPLDIIPEINLLNSVADVGVSQQFPVEPKELHAWMIETLALGKYGLRSELGPFLDQIAVIIYKGNDLRGENGVVFDVALDQFEEASYLLSRQAYKNVMITAAANGMEFASMGTPPSGLARRVAFQDLSSEVTLPAGTPLTDLLINKGKVKLADLLPTNLFSGGVSSSIGEGYNDIYALGDIVRLQGEYGLSQDARVAEFVRTEDTSGTKAYPTFEAVAS